MPRTKQFACVERSNKVKNCLDAYSRMRGASEESLGKVIGTDKRGYRRRYENPEKFSLGELWDISQYLKCPIEELVGGESNKAEISKMADIFACVLEEVRIRETANYSNPQSR